MENQNKKPLDPEKKEPQKKNLNLSNGELLSAIRRKIKVTKQYEMDSILNAIDGTPKLDSLRTSLIDAIKDPSIVPPYELRLLYINTFHLPTETPEMQQLHEIQNGYLEEHKKIREDVLKLQHENRYLRYIVLGLAIGSGLVGILSEEILSFIIRGFSF